MHKTILTSVILLAATWAQATLTISSGTLNTTIPDGSSVGITSTLNVSGAGTILSPGDNVSVTLNLSGGYNGDLYAYLSFNGTTVVLLNRPGVTGGNLLGYTDAGFNNVTLSGGNSVNVDSYGGGGVPSNVSFNPSAGGTAFQAYNGMSANGNWTLFFADLSGGDGGNTSTLNSWSLDITAVPEPVNVALTIFLGLAALGGLGRWWKDSEFKFKERMELDVE
jgi:subtilisin-like proprotein convertase family protein